MKIYDAHEYCQGADDGKWLQLRFGKVTASEIGRILTNELKIRDSKGVDSYVAEKLAEVWRGVPNPSFGSKATDNGTLYEMDSRAAVMLACEIEPDQMLQVGFCETDDGLAGCSPDGLIESDYMGLGPGGLELKNPGPAKHAAYLITDELPADYYLQTHMSMAVTGRQWWLFASASMGGAAIGHKSLPLFLKFVRRDEKICAALGQAVAAFHEKFTAGMERLKKYESQ